MLSYFTESETTKILNNTKTRFSILPINLQDIHVERKKKTKNTKAMLSVGDIFTVNGKKYVINKSEKKLLISVIAKDWRKEGHGSPEEAKEEYKKKGFFGERVINGELRYLGDMDFLTYVFSHEFIPLKDTAPAREEQLHQIVNEHQETERERKILEKERRKEETWIKSNPEYFTQIMNGVEVETLKLERRWNQWEKHSRRRIH
jgi:hypothetical protein